MSREPYKTYSREFKIEAVRLADQSDKPVTQLAIVPVAGSDLFCGHHFSNA